MSKYTMELRQICESFSPSVTPTYDNVDTIISAARTHIFDFTYQLTDSTHKSALETKIIQHFYTREICCEAYGQWHLWLKDKMQMIMPLYDQRYVSAALTIHPLTDHGTSKSISGSDQSTKTTNGETSNSTDNTQTNTNNLTDTNAYSDTPQGSLTGVDNNTYLTSYTKEGHTGTVTQLLDSDGSSEYSSTDLSSETHSQTETESGYGRPEAELLEVYRKAMLNVDEEICKELEDLFMSIY